MAGSLAVAFYFAAFAFVTVFSLSATAPPSSHFVLILTFISALLTAPAQSRKDENGVPLTYIGISPANDTAQATKNIYLGEVYDVIRRSSNPNVRTHLFGMTSLDALAKYPCYSADSISHRLQAAYNKIFTRRWGTISLSDKSRTNKTKSNMSFLETCDASTYKEFEAFAANYGFTVDQLKESSAARVAVCIVEIQQALKNEYAYHPANRTKSRKLF